MPELLVSAMVNGVREAELCTAGLINKLREVEWKLANLIMMSTERDILARARVRLTAEINSRLI